MIDVTGKIVVITGSLRPLTRQEAVVFLENQGAIVQNYVSAQTEILIAGHKQLDLFEPDKRSKKYEAVMKRKASGQNITIISEEAFFTLVKESHV
ncbi:BRCT domain-containing protein [Streptococcus gallolyticus]|uniref:BRCT domain-containing protein n=1 Tax=Streptococcus gallolyticus TaxID=315405 RepID=UPI00031E3667|nr:BRCT domain-containing protein [Streptococcus gallolyticus]